MPVPIPEWKAWTMAALGNMPRELRAARAEARKVAEEKASARREKHAETRREIIALTLAGFSGPEIAEATGANLDTTRSRLQRLAIAISKAGYRRLPSGWLKTETRDALDALAADRGIEPFDLVAKLLDVALEDGAVKAKAMLRNSFPRLVRDAA